MTDRLISENALIKDMEQRYFKGKVTLRELIDEQPTAFDVNSLIEMFEEHADEEWTGEDILYELRNAGVVVAKKETPTEHTCENCDNRESCDYYHYSGKDWKEYIGIECDEWKGGAE